MNDPLKTLLQPNPLKMQLFPPNSRYHGIDTETTETAEGKTVIYLRRRFVPAPEQFSQIQEHTVVQGDRTDNLAAQYQGDPEMYWQLCDANGVMRPEELTETIGKKLRITLPEGIPGVPHG
jgi:hypothetical protein